MRLFEVRRAAAGINSSSPNLSKTSQSMYYCLEPTFLTYDRQGFLLLFSDIDNFFKRSKRFLGVEWILYRQDFYQSNSVTDKGVGK